jgi:hypothetical protein
VIFLQHLFYESGKPTGLFMKNWVAKVWIKRLFCIMCRFGFYILLFVVVFSVTSKTLADESVGYEGEAYFDNDMLQNPREHALDLLERFQNKETGTYNVAKDSLVVFLSNGYALAPIINAGNYNFDKSRYRVAKIEVVFTKYPFDKKNWLTNYYDLLAWRLMALFDLDPSLNNSDISWNLVLQTDCKTANAARQMFHGVVLFLDTIDIVINENPPLVEDDPVEIPASSIINGGFIMREDRNPNYFMSPMQYQPDPGRPLRTNMDPKKLKCPTWR